jgi:hypothetical protein
MQQKKIDKETQKKIDYLIGKMKEVEVVGQLADKDLLLFAELLPRIYQ